MYRIFSMPPDTPPHYDEDCNDDVDGCKDQRRSAAADESAEVRSTVSSIDTPACAEDVTDIC